MYRVMFNGRGTAEQWTAASSEELTGDVDVPRELLVSDAWTCSRLRMGRQSLMNSHQQSWCTKRRPQIPTTEMTLLVIGGLVLFLGSMIGLTTFGGKYPRATLSIILLTLVVYVAIILVRLGIIGSS